MQNQKFSDYEKKGTWEGTDASLEISLFEYGLMWEPFKDKGCEEEEYRFIFGIEANSDGNFCKFDYGFVNKKGFTKLIDESWFNLKGILSYSGDTRQDLIDRFPNSVYTCVQYHGYENVFGSAYTSFEIDNDEE